MVDSALAEVVWRVVPLEPPRVLRHCSRCERTCPFASTHKFRLNAQQRHIDVWLLYRCVHCDTTWKREIMARRRPQEIEAGLYQRFLHNDAATARSYAFDTGGLPCESDADVRVERPAIDTDGGGGPLRILLCVAHPTSVRLDRMLASELGLTRSELGRRLLLGELEVEGNERALRRPPRDGQILLLWPSARRGP